VGLVTAEILVGVLMIALQMLPLGGKMLGYRPYTDALQPRQRLAPFYPDEFTLGVAKVLSRGGLAGRQPFGKVHDDLRLELYCARNRMEQVRELEHETREVTERFGRVDALPDALRSAAAYRLPEAVQAADVPANPLLTQTDAAGAQTLVVRAAVSETARNAEDDWWRLPATHFRLTVRDPDGRFRSHWPLAYLTAGQTPDPLGWSTPAAAHGQWALHPAEEDNHGRALVGKLGVGRQWSGKTGPEKLLVDWVYRIPAKAVPVGLAFRRVARREVDLRGLKAGAPPPAGGALLRYVKPER
jgi:hypothetical protein